MLHVSIRKRELFLPLLSQIVSTVLSNEVLVRPHVEGGLLDDRGWSFLRSLDLSPNVFGRRYCHIVPSGGGETAFMEYKNITCKHEEMKCAKP